jgi:hypothetical protein
LEYGFGDFRFQIVIEDGEAEQDEAALRLISLLRGKHLSLTSLNFFVLTTVLLYTSANMTDEPFKLAKGRAS